MATLFTMLAIYSLSGCKFAIIVAFLLFSPCFKVVHRRMMYIPYTFNDKQARIYMSDVYTEPSASEIAYAVQRQLSSAFGSVHILFPGSNCITHFGAGFGFETPLDSCRNLCLMPEYRFVVKRH